MEYYKGQRVDELLEIIKEMENRLKLLTVGIDPFSLARYEEVAHGYANLALAKAKLSSLKGDVNER
jgi:predicted S18 family serine protease